MLVLASNDGKIVVALIGYGLLNAAACSVIYGLVVVSSMWVAQRKWRPVSWCALLWAAGFPILWIVESGIVLSRTGDISHGPWLEAILPTVISAALLAGATRSWLPVAGCVVGYGLTLAGAWEPLMPGAGQSVVCWWLFGAPWLAAVATSLAAWAWWARRSTLLPGHCLECGYDRRGTVGRVCPECGSGAALRQ